MADVAVQSLLQGMKSDTKVVGGASTNIPNADTSGFREVVDHYISSADRFGGGVTTKRTINFAKTGNIVETGLQYNMAIEGAKGMFFVKYNDEVLNTRSGDFSLNKNGLVQNINGAILMGLPYDDKGVMADVNEKELTEVKINTVDILEPLATSNVDVDLNFNARASVMGGGSQSFNFNSGTALAKDTFFTMNAAVRKNDGISGEKTYKFIYNDAAATTPTFNVADGVTEITFSTNSELEGILNGTIKIPDEEKEDIKMRDVIENAKLDGDILYFNARSDSNGNVVSTVDLVEGSPDGLLKALGLAANTTAGQKFEMNQLYSPYDSGNNMAGKHVKSDYSKEFTVIDDLGGKHVGEIAVKRIGASEWAVEVFAAKGEPLSEGSRSDGLVAAGTIKFDHGKLANDGITAPTTATMTSSKGIAQGTNADKAYKYKINGQDITLKTSDTLKEMVKDINTASTNPKVKASLILDGDKYRIRLETSTTTTTGDLIKIEPQDNSGGGGGPKAAAQAFLENTLGLQTELKAITGLSTESKVTFDWNKEIFGSDPTEVTLNFDNLTQYVGDFSGDTESDGRTTGFFRNASVDKDGNLLGMYTNGETKKLYNIPLGFFNNPGALEMVEGGMFRETAESGDRKMALSGKEGMGSVVGQRLELSNTDTNSQLTNVVEANSNYTAAAKAYGIKLRMDDTLYKEI